MPQWSKRAVGIVGGVFVIGLLGGAAWFWRTHPETAQAEASPPVTDAVRREVVARQPYPREWLVAATVRPRETAVLSAETTARVLSVAVKVGDAVRAGQTLITLDAAVPTAAMATAQAEVAAVKQAADAARWRVEVAEAALRGAQAEYELAQTLYNRQEKLFQTGDVPRQSVDVAEGRLKAADAARIAAERRLEAERADLAQTVARIDVAERARREAETRVGQTRLVAPFAGRVAERLADPGALAAPSVPLLVVESDGSLRAVAEVEAERAARLSVGQPLRVEMPDHQFVTGTLVEQSPAANLTTRTVTVKVELPPTVNVRSGMFVRVAIPRDTVEVVTVPQAAVMEQGGLQSVFTLGADGVVRRRIVTLGERFGDRVEVLTGLREGETVVFGSSALRDGVRLANGAAKP
ncbi:MAG: efflux RND transporter periplasmic adaptor subunit [Chloracidobacterium sp.]|nr:efflux RND transporter periplasmic adaptor subunit [Chloracidobacterium sp.]MDW8217609.1 efflux RND transporter periplasmic adaptor subunit [Acidobacteriota bacterium]